MKNARLAASALAACAVLVAVSSAGAQPRAARAVPGVTAKTITIANISDITGAIPGIFLGSQLGTEAYVRYVNSTGGVFGRKIVLKGLDNQFSCTQNQALTQANVGKVFAFVGQTSIFDSCGASILAQYPNVPDVSFTFDKTTGELPNYFSAVPYKDAVATSPLVYLKTKFPQAVSDVGILVGNTGATVNHQIDLQVGAMASLGYKVVYRDAISSVTPATVTPEIVRMRQAGVQFVAITAVDSAGVAAFVNAAQQQGWTPAVIWNSGTAYDSTFAKTVAPGATNNLIITTNVAPFLNPKANAGVKLFRKWLNVTKPGYVPDVWAAYSWSSTALFVEALRKAGPNFTQASVLAALKAIHRFDAGGMLGVTDVGDKYPSICEVMLTFQNGVFKPIDKPAKKGQLFTCKGKIWTP